MRKIGYLANDATHGDRWTLYHLDGTVSNWFPIDMTYDAVCDVLKRHGFSVDSNDQVSVKE